MFKKFFLLIVIFGTDVGWGDTLFREESKYNKIFNLLNLD